MSSKKEPTKEDLKREIEILKLKIRIAELEKELAEKQQAYTKAFQMLIQDPTNDLQAAKRIMYKKMMPDLTDEEISEIIGKDSQNAMQDLPQNSQPQPMPEQPMADQPQQMPDAQLSQQLQPEGQM